MSHQATTWVMEFSQSRLSDRLIMLAIAHRVSNDNGEAFPSVGTIAREANVSESTVHDALKRLQKLGELEVKIGASRFGTNIYLMPKFYNWHQAIRNPNPGRGGGTDFAPTKSERAIQRVQTNPESSRKSGPEPSLTNIIKPSEEERKAIAAAFQTLEFEEPIGDDQFQQIFAEEWHAGGCSASAAMERAIKRCRAAKVNIPYAFYATKRRVERVEAENKFRRPPPL